MSTGRYIAKLLAVTAEVCGAEIRSSALALMAEELSGYPLSRIEAALSRIRREFHGRFSLAAVIERLHAEDSRPDADEAWAVALAALDEYQTVVWTRECAVASLAVRPLIDGGDLRGAYEAFCSIYRHLVNEARRQSLATEWQVSLGFDASRRKDALIAALHDGIISHERARRILPTLFDGTTNTPDAQEPGVSHDSGTLMFRGTRGYENRQPIS